MIEVRHLHLLTSIVREGSLTRAASRLHVTQSALSHQLKDLEGKLGVALFERQSRRMALTAAGERLLEAANPVLDALRRAETDIRALDDSARGELRIATECYTCYHWLPSRLRAYAERYPHVDVRLVIEATHHPLPALENGDLDVAVVIGAKRGAKFRLQKLFSDELVAVVAPDHPLASRDYLRPRDFADQHVIAYDADEKDLCLFREILDPAGVRPKKISHVQLTEAILELVKAGLGIAAMASWAVAPHVESGAVRKVSLSKNGVYRQWSAATLRRKKPLPHVADFIDRLCCLDTDPTGRGRS